MKAALLLLAVAGAALVTATQASARQACKPGDNTAGRTFCGPAKATLRVHGKKYRYNQGGNCSIDGSTWTLNIGTISLHGKPKRAYFGITVFSKKAGTHGAAVTWQRPNGTTASLLNAKVTLARGLKKGTFTGSINTGGGKGTGSFSCK